MSDHPVDISETRFTPDRRDPNTEWAGHGFKELPFDLPLHMKVTRHLTQDDSDPPIRGLIGWSVDLELDARANVKIKMAKAGRWEIFIDGEKVASGVRR